MIAKANRILNFGERIPQPDPKELEMRERDIERSGDFTYVSFDDLQRAFVESDSNSLDEIIAEAVRRKEDALGR